MNEPHSTGQGWAEEARRWFDDKPTDNPVSRRNIQMSFHESFGNLHSGIIKDLEALHGETPEQDLGGTSLAVMVDDRAVIGGDPRESFWWIMRSIRIADPVSWPKDAVQDIYDPNFQFYFMGEPLSARAFWRDHPNADRRTSGPVGLMIVFNFRDEEKASSATGSPVYEFQGMRDESPLVPLVIVKQRQIDFESLDPDSKKLVQAATLVFNQLSPRFFDEEVMPSSLEQLGQAENTIERISPSVDLVDALYDQILFEEGTSHHRAVAMAVRNSGIQDPKTIEEYFELIYNAKKTDSAEPVVSQMSLEHAPFFIAYWEHHAAMRGITLDKKRILKQLTTLYQGQAAGFHLASNHRAGQDNEDYLERIALSYRIRSKLTSKMIAVLDQAESSDLL